VPLNAGRLVASQVASTALQEHQRRCQERGFDDGEHAREPLFISSRWLDTESSPKCIGHSRALTQRFCNLFRLGAIHFYLRLHRRYSACSLLRSTCRRKPLFRRCMCWEGVDALHNNVFGTKIMKDGSQRREPETSVFVLIARRMEPEHPAVRLKGHSAQAPEWPFAVSRSVSARRKRAVIEIARSKARSRGAAYRPCTARLIESPTAY
jgi:hypothetical protein